MKAAVKQHRDDEKDYLRRLRWKIVCVQPYEQDFSYDEAVLEVSTARHVCDCGGDHEMVPMEEDR